MIRKNWYCATLVHEIFSQCHATSFLMLISWSNRKFSNKKLEDFSYAHSHINLYLFSFVRSKWIFCKQKWSKKIDISQQLGSSLKSDAQIMQWFWSYINSHVASALGPDHLWHSPCNVLLLLERLAFKPHEGQY